VFLKRVLGVLVREFTVVRYLVLFAVILSPAALAVDPANLQAGPVFITPTLDTRVGYVDNLFRSKEDKKNTGFSVITPRVQAWMANGPSTYSFTTALVDYRYFDSSDDDITDNTYNLDVHHEFNARNTVNLFAEYWDFHETRGVGVSEGIAPLLDGPVKLDRSTIGGDYLYGSESSSGRLKLGAQALEHDYKNFPKLTRYRSRDRYQYGSTFLWRIAERTDAVFEVRYIDTEYDRLDPSDAAGSLDSDEINYLAGVNWEATAKTSGSVKVGMIDRDYSSDDRSDDDVFSWEADVTYSPRTYSHFNLASRRYFDETNGLGNAVETEDITLSWNHDWDSYSSTVFRVRAGNLDYTESERQDDLYGAEASYNYAFRRWIDLGVGYRFEDIDSDLEFYDYTRNEVFLEAKVSL
jgi:hypothetical protein